jgi:hypothetical protein
MRLAWYKLPKVKSQGELVFNKLFPLWKQIFINGEVIELKIKKIQEQKVRTNPPLADKTELTQGGLGSEKIFSVVYRYALCAWLCSHCICHPRRDSF